MKYRAKGGNPRPLPGRKPKKPLKPGRYPHLTLRLGRAARRQQVRLADKVRELVTLLTPGQSSATPDVRNVASVTDPVTTLLSLNESHFKVCERDHLGHCLPGQGTSGSQGTPGRTGDGKSASLMGRMKTAVAKAKGVIDVFNKRMEAIKQGVRSAPEHGLGESLLKWFVNAGDFSKNLTKKFYDAVASRYGHKAALTVMASGQALGWGAMAKGVYLPMVSVWGSLPAVAVAETFLQAGRLGKKLYQAHKAAFNAAAARPVPPPPPPSGVPIRALVKQLRQGLGSAYLKYLEKNRAAISSAFWALGITSNAQVETYFGRCERDDKGHCLPGGGTADVNVEKHAALPTGASKAHLKEYTAQQEPELSNDSRRMLRGFPGTKELNAEVGNGFSTERSKEYATRLDAAFEEVSPLGAPVQVWRGVSDSSRIYADLHSGKLKEGDQYVIPAYLSTSATRGKAEPYSYRHFEDSSYASVAATGQKPVILKITADPKLKALSVDPWSPLTKDHEFVFPRGTVLTVTKMVPPSKAGETTVVHVQASPGKAAPIPTKGTPKAGEPAAPGWLRELFSGNAFCPTGLGGGIDPTCSPGGSSGGAAVVEGGEPQTDKRVGTVATPEEYKRAVKVAKKKFATVPAPTPKEIQEAQDGIARKGVNLYRKDLLGNSKDRKRRRAVLLNEFGDGKVCPCIYCGVRIGEGTMEQDKILTTRQGGRYRVPNLLPSCSGCNKRRGDTPFSEVVKKLKA